MATSGDYISALEVIKNAFAVIEDDPGLSEKADEYENSYVAGVIANIESSLNGNDVPLAEEQLTAALAVLPNNQKLQAEKAVLQNATPKSLLMVCPPYRTKNCEQWENLSIAGTKYPIGVSVGRTGSRGDDGYALFNLDGKYRTLYFEVGNIDERGNASNEMLAIYLDGNLVWSLELKPEAMPKRYEVSVIGANQMKITGTTWAGDFGIVNMVISGKWEMSGSVPSTALEDGIYLLNVCTPYQSENFEEWSNLAICGRKYPTGISVGRTGSRGGDGYVLFNLDGEYDTLTFDVGNIDVRGTAKGQSLYLYSDGNLIWSLDLNPEALLKHYSINISGTKQLKITGSTWAGDYGIVNLRVE